MDHPGLIQLILMRQLRSRLLELQAIVNGEVPTRTRPDPEPFVMRFGGSGADGFFFEGSAVPDAASNGGGEIGSLLENLMLLRAISLSLEESQTAPTVPPITDAGMKVVRQFMLTRTALAERKESAGEEGAGRDCVICQEEMEWGTRCAELPCAHFFCEACIMPWLKHTRSCPVCRREIVGSGESSTQTPSSRSVPSPASPSRAVQPEAPPPRTHASSQPPAPSSTIQVRARAAEGSRLEAALLPATRPPRDARSNDASSAPPIRSVTSVVVPLTFTATPPAHNYTATATPRAPTPPDLDGARERLSRAVRLREEVSRTRHGGDAPIAEPPSPASPPSLGARRLRELVERERESEPPSQPSRELPRSFRRHPSPTLEAAAVPHASTGPRTRRSENTSTLRESATVGRQQPLHDVASGAEGLNEGDREIVRRILSVQPRPLAEGLGQPRPNSRSRPEPTPPVGTLRRSSTLQPAANRPRPQ